MRENLRVMAHGYLDPWNLWGTFGWYVMLAMTMMTGLVCGAAFTVIVELNREPGPSPVKILGGLCCSLSRLALMVFYVLVVVRLAQTARERRWFITYRGSGAAT